MFSFASTIHERRDIIRVWEAGEFGNGSYDSRLFTWCWSEKQRVEVKEEEHGGRGRKTSRLLEWMTWG